MRDEVAAVSMADELAKLGALHEQGVLTVSEFETEKERLLASAPPAPLEGVSSGTERRSGARMQRVVLVTALLVVVVVAGVASLVLVTTGNGPSAPPHPNPLVVLAAPAEIAGYTLQPGTVYRAADTLYAGYQQTAPARAFAVSVFVQSSPGGARAAVHTYLRLAEANYSDVTPVTTQRDQAVTYSCFSGRETDQGQAVPAAVCGWSHGRATFTMVLAPTSETQDVVALAPAVTRAIV